MLFNFTHSCIGSSAKMITFGDAHWLGILGYGRLSAGDILLYRYGGLDEAALMTSCKSVVWEKFLSWNFRPNPHSIDICNATDIWINGGHRRKDHYHAGQCVSLEL
jgi:hypothetical protein